MPRLNGTGPMGQGSMTGRGLGSCGGGIAYGRKMGRGLGGRMGFRFSQPTKTDDVNNTKAYIEDLEAELKGAQSYLKDLGDQD